MFVSIDCSVCSSRFGPVLLIKLSRQNLCSVDKASTYQMSGRTIPILGHLLIWHKAANPLWYDIHVLSMVNPQGDTTTQLSWGSQWKVVELGGSKAEFQRGNPIWRHMKPGGFPCWDSAAGLGAPAPNPVIQSLTPSAQLQPRFFIGGWRVLNAWRRTP